MFDGLFSLGLAGPLLLLFFGFVAIGLSFSGTAMAERRRWVVEPVEERSQRKIDWAIGLLAVSALSVILASIISHFGGYGFAFFLAFAGLILLWPASAVFALWGRGAGRGKLLVAHVLIALWVAGILLAIRIHGV